MKQFTPTTNRSYNDLQLSNFSRLMPIYKEALKAGMWLYHKEDKVWWTPEEFYAEFTAKEMNNYFVSGMLENLVIRDPIAGIKAANKQLDEKLEQMKTETDSLRLKIQDFTKKALSYYQDKSQNRKP